jgi:hypothetical protein
MVNTAVFIVDTTQVNLLVMRVNKSCTIEDANICSKRVDNLDNYKLQTIKNKTYILGKLCIFHDITIEEIVKTLDEPDELQPDRHKFYATPLQVTCILNNKRIDAFIVRAD